jgi:ABC-2 type transport system permease protein
MNSVARTVFARELAAAFRSTAFYTGLAAFLALSAGLFFAALQISEGTFWSLPALWALAVALPLPLLTILLTMPLFAGERAAGTLPLLLILPISLRGLLIGKFLAAYSAVLLTISGALVPWLFLAHNLAGKLPPLVALLPAIGLLALHALSWTALGLLASILARRPWAAAVGTILLGGGAMLVWASLSRLLLGSHLQAPAFPLLLELLDAAAGRVDLRSVVFHVSFTIWCLYIGWHVLEDSR